jgi:hypothetical protein
MFLSSMVNSNDSSDRPVEIEWSLDGVYLLSIV